MFETEKIFLGNTPAAQRRYLLYALTKLKNKFDSVIIPCAGQFALAKIAIEAGFPKEKIYTSDISAFSSLLGYYYSKKKIPKGMIELDDKYKEEYKAYKKTEEKIAFIFWIMKTCQVNSGKYYLWVIRNELFYQKKRIIEKTARTIKEQGKYYSGINYEIKDIRELLEDEHDKKSILLINPPAYKYGYKKMFSFEPEIRWNIVIKEFDWKSEYVSFYMGLRKKKVQSIWYRYQNVDDLPKKDIVFAKEYSKKRNDYWLSTRVADFKKLKIRKLISVQKLKSVQKLNIPVIDEGMKITEDTKISFKAVNKETANYYRDLFAHKLGTVDAESYCIMLLDGKIFGMTGFMLEKVKRFKENSIFEVFGFNTHLKGYPNANRLLMMAITTKAFGKYLLEGHYKVNRLQEVKSFKTTCLSKYRKVKLNNGLLKITKREKMDSGMYKIVYETELYDRDYGQVILDYLNEVKNERKN